MMEGSKQEIPTEDVEFLGFKINALGEQVAEFRDKNNSGKTFVLDKENIEIREKNLKKENRPFNATSDALLSWPKETKQ